MLERLLLNFLLFVLRLIRRIVQTEPKMFTLLGSPTFQPMLARIGRMKAMQVYLRARAECPAYKSFLAENSVPAIKTFNDWSLLPTTTKENYVKKYDIESRCYGGKIPSKGVVIDESSGSSGVPNSWVRGPEERHSVKAIMQISYTLMFHDQDFFILNCFALGPWATGMNVSMSLVDVAIMKSIGPDRAKLENSLKQFGTKYRYLVAGYPPFIKNFVDTTTLDLTQYNLHLVVGGEGMSEGLRAYFGKWFKSVFSSYGASDLEINIGAETELAIKLRQACSAESKLSLALFGREDPPMIFQYNPLDYVIEENANGEMIFTIARLANVAPKIRYNLHDRGGVYRYADLAKKLNEHGVDITCLVKKAANFPFLFVYGRTDLSVPFFGCKVFTSDLDQIIYHDPLLAKNLNSFQIQNEEDQQFNRQLHLHLERSEGSTAMLDETSLHDAFYQGLMRVNQDFREITKMITPQHVKITLHAYGSGPFANRDIRIKNRYIAAN